MDIAEIAACWAQMRRRVESGASFLDGKIENWAGRINLGTLDLADMGCCVLGQLYGEYFEGADALGLDPQMRLTMGFTREGGSWRGDALEEWDVLTAMWVTEIRTRRGLE